MRSRTNIVLDDRLVRRAMQRAGVRTKREAVQAALEHYTRKTDYGELLALYGSGGVVEGYDRKPCSTKERPGHDPRDWTEVIAVIVDTSVWVDYLRGEQNPAVHYLLQALRRSMEITLVPVVLQETLQRQPRNNGRAGIESC